MLWSNLVRRATTPWRRDVHIDDDVLEHIRFGAESLRTSPDRRLAERFQELRRRRETATPVELFPLLLEAARRGLGVDLYDEQLRAGWAMAQGAVVELQTGEGKTFVAMLPAAWYALRGQGVHVMTVNSYLARRDCELLTPSLGLLGLTVGLLDSPAPAERRAAYACDVTYGPGCEFGFDFLRDRVARLAADSRSPAESLRERMRGRDSGNALGVQRGHAAAVIDEADSVMLDEAATPLVIAGAGVDSPCDAELFRAAASVASDMLAGRDYVLEPTGPRLIGTSDRSAWTTPPRSQQTRLKRPWSVYIEQALRAQLLLRRDVDYVVQDDQLLFVDRTTGRVHAERTWRDGLHQALQVKERLPVTAETRSLARVTRQRYFRLYERVCGMTGTVTGAERELRAVYGVEIVPIPPHRPCRREEWRTRVFSTCDAKERAIADAARELQATGRPVLIGAPAIEVSERLSRRLAALGLDHRVLNGKQDASEAEIVARGGERGAITVATNMAGRGTDIRLGEGVAELGGLHVIATEPQAARRLDRQLMGRAARQGDPGSFQRFVAADDPLLAESPRLARRMVAAADAQGEARLDIDRALAAAQRAAERRQADSRVELYRHDDWLEQTIAKLAPQ